MGYAPLGARPVIATPDATGLNTGNWTVVFDLSQIGVTVPYFELYHLFITSGTNATTQTNAKVMLNLYDWDATLIAQLNSWDPSQPMLCTPGDTIYILFDVPTSTLPPPTATCWFRYDPSLLKS